MSTEKRRRNGGGRTQGGGRIFQNFSAVNGRKNAAKSGTGRKLKNFLCKKTKVSAIFCEKGEKEAGNLTIM
jgi:hypothetical protein